jgi:CHAT domain-containing protein/tetratricopeptide (TPR) repeat protein
MSGGRAAALALLAGLALACGDRAERVSLAPGAVFPRTIRGGNPHRFLFQADAGRFLHLAVDQRGVDVVVLLRDPAGRLAYETDSASGTKAAETVLLVTETAGDYSLSVEPFHRGSEGGFALEVLELRPASPADRTRMAAAAPFARGERRRLSGDLEAAADAYRAALAPLAALGDHKKLAETWWRLGQSLSQAGELRAATAALEQAVARFQAEGDRLREAYALGDLGGARRELGEIRAALAAYRQALSLFQAAGNEVGVAGSLNNVGLALTMQDDIEGAIDCFEQALAIWDRRGTPASKAVPLENLGRLYSLIGHDGEALDLLSQALGLLGPRADLRRRASLLATLGWAEYWAGQPEKALRRYDEALTLAERSRDRISQVGFEDRRGSVLRALHRLDEARAAYDKALAGSLAIGNRLGEGSTLANLGWLDLETGAAGRARERLERAAALLAEGGDPNGEVYARVGLSRAERLAGNYGPARREAETAVLRVEELRGGLRGAVSRGQFLATRFNAYEELVTLLMDLDHREPGKGHDREALEWAERSRAGNLLEEMAAHGGEGEPPLRGKGIHPMVSTLGLVGRDALLAEIHALEERRQTRMALTDAADRDARLSGLAAALRARRLELDRLAPPRVQSSVPRLITAEIQSLADPQSLLVVYLLAEPVSFAWTVDRESVVSHTLPGKARIEALSRRVAAGLAQGPHMAAEATLDAALRDLSQAALGPLASRLQGRRLVFLPDGALHLVPFAVLPEPVPGGGEPLLVRHEIALIPSATVLSWQRRHLAVRPLQPGIVAILADPVFGPDDARVAGAGQTPEDAGQAGRPSTTTFRRLPFTAEEARAILAVVPREKALLAEGSTASGTLVRSGVLHGYRILHFATHGLLDPVLPEWSGLVLSGVDATGRARSEFLAAPAIAELDLPAELVVLSGCQTGLGREVRGEGLVGLPQAFFRAGTRRVIVSSWNVQDRATAQLMTRLYLGLLRDRLTPAAALRSAQLSLRQEGAWHSPYFWAGFSLQGDWR